MQGLKLNEDEILRAIPTTDTILEQLPKIDAEINDTVLNWLIEQNFVASTRDEWVSLICPWSHAHTPGRDDHAGYKPLGRGNRPLIRGFRCHHEHCKDKTTEVFLRWIGLNGGPQANIFGFDELPLNVVRNNVESVSLEEKEALYRISLPKISAELRQPKNT